MELKDFNKLSLKDKQEMIVNNTQDLNINEDYIEHTYESLLQSFLLIPNPIREERLLYATVLEFMYKIESEFTDSLVEDMGQIPFILWIKQHLQGNEVVEYYINTYQIYKKDKNGLYSVVNTILDQFLEAFETMDTDTLDGLGNLLKETMSKIPSLN